MSEGSNTRRRMEIVHESLLTEWPRLVRWQAQDEEGVQLRDELRQAARLWEQHHRSEDYLWSGTAFREYQLWRERYSGGLTTLEEAFAAAMRAKARRRRLLGTAVVTVALAVALVTSGLWRRSETAREQAVAAERQARGETRRAEASKLLALAQLREEEDPTEALAYTVASLELADSEDARHFALRLLWQAPPALEAALGGVDHRFPAFSPDGGRVAVGGHSSELRVLEARGGEPPLVLPGHPPQGSKFALWAADDLVVTEDGGFTERVHVWRLPGGERVRTIELAGPSKLQTGRGTLVVETLEVNGDRQILRLRSWALPDGEARDLGRVDWSALAGAVEWDSHSGFRTALVPDGSGWLYARGAGLYLQPLPVGDGRPDRLLGRHSSEITELWPLAVDPPRVYSLDREGEIRVWDFSRAEPRLVATIARPEGAPADRAPDLSSRWAVGDVGSALRATSARQARVWDLTAWPQARPLALRRSGSWYASSAAFDPGGDWVAVTTGSMERLTFWPLRRARPWVVDGYDGLMRPLAFDPEGRWLASLWPGQTIRLWPLPGSGQREPRQLAVPEGTTPRQLAFDPQARLVLAGDARPAVAPLDGSPARQPEAPSPGSYHFAAAVAPSGERVATAFSYGKGPAVLQIWDLESGEIRLLGLPPGSLGPETGYGRSIQTLAFTDETTLYSAGDGGVRRWDLERDEHELVLPSRPGNLAALVIGSDARTALVAEQSAIETSTGSRDASSLRLVDLTTGATRDLSGYPTSPGRPHSFALSGGVVVAGDGVGKLRVGEVAGGEPHLLLGHDGPIDSVAISPDQRWIASTGEDDTLRLWPMPDLDEPPLHTLPRDELLAVLHAQTNIRVVEDPDSPSGRKVDLAPFPGWSQVPEW